MQSAVAPTPNGSAVRQASTTDPGAGPANADFESAGVTGSRPVGGILSGSRVADSVDDHPSLRPTRECLRTGRPLPAWPCSGWGLPSHPGRPGCWCALTAPFHPCLPGSPEETSQAVCFLWHFPASHLDWRKPAPFPTESRPSSTQRTAPRPSSRLPVTH